MKLLANRLIDILIIVLTIIAVVVIRSAPPHAFDVKLIYQGF